MVALNKAGFRDWLIQRISAIVIGSYAIIVLGFFLFYPDPSYASWQHFYSNAGMRIYTIVTLCSVLWHAWIGLWTVFTDYVKPKCLRLFLEIFLVLLLITYLVWCLNILWA